MQLKERSEARRRAASEALEQLCFAEAAKESAIEGGAVLYLRGHEGRGIGLANKIAAYSLQEKGFDTVDANRALGLPDDAREYSAVKNILEDLGVKSIQLMTNNPRKIEKLTALGIAIEGGSR